MPLRAHLSELRNRLVKAGIAIVLGAIIGWFLYEPKGATISLFPWLEGNGVFDLLQAPVQEASRTTGSGSTLNFQDVTGAFNLQLKLAMYLGLVFASPVWLYQLWAFILPGLTRNEKRYALGFSFVAVTLFLAGLALAWSILPTALAFFAGFVPEGTAAFNSVDGYFSFVTRLMLSFGAAFVVPLVLVGMNMMGMVSAITLAKGWRIAVFACFLFAAMASPTAEVSVMFLLAMPMIGLYLIAVGVAWFVDRRRARRFDNLKVDEASDIEAPEAVDAPEAL